MQKARLLVELIEKRKKHFAALRAQEKRNNPPTKTQMKSQMSTYLKHIGGYKQSHLKGGSFDEIKELFDREMRKVNDSIVMDSEAQESSTKRTAEHLESDIFKKQKFGSGRRVKSPLEKDSLGAQEDASKQRRTIEEIDQNAEIALDDETQGRTNDDEMFGVDDLAGEVVMDSVVEPVTTVKDSAALTTDVTEDEITMAQALAALKSVKPKVVQSQISTISSSKNKGKAKIIEPEVLIKKKDQMRIDEEYVRKLTS
nr:hypothetical protein [Tanacetum cinerariifolium]